MKSATLIDGSALLSLIYQETGSDQIQKAVIKGAAMSALCVTEVMSVLIKSGWSIEEAKSIIEDLNIEVLPFDRECAMFGAQIMTKETSLSKSDIACLATALAFKTNVLTANPGLNSVRITGVRTTLLA